MLDIRQDILDFLQTKEDPTKLRSIRSALGLPASDRQFLKDVLAELVREGLVIKRDTRYWLPEGKQNARRVKREKSRRGHQVTGLLSITSRGFGFVEAARGDWLIPEGSLGGAVHGDLVRAEKREKGRDGRIIGEVIEIVEFGMAVVLGVFERTPSGVAFLPFRDVQLDRRDMMRFPRDAEHGAVGRWTRRDDGRWLFDGFIGHINDPKIDEEIAISENGIRANFTDDVVQEAAGFKADYPFSPEGRTDFRNELVFTVDGETARDFDDALHFKWLEGGDIEVGIHIADVSHFVTEDSALDRWSAEQGNSVYLPHKAIPMLPEILSSELCSLKPGVPRYTLSVLARVERDGRLVDYRFCKGLIQSAYRLTYNDVMAIAVDREEGARMRFEEVAPSLDMGLDLSRKILKRRYREGGLELDMSSVRITLTEEMELDDVYAVSPTPADRLIEAFMCLANECVATFFSKLEIDIPYRIHEQPTFEKLENLILFLRSFGIQAPAHLFENTGRGLNDLIRKFGDSLNGQVMRTQLLRSLKLAEYNPDNRGHFGLALEHYAHFTSPIRRYADLLIHRRLTRVLTEENLGPEDFNDSRLEQICAHISKKERDAERTGSTFTRLKLLRRMKLELGNEFEGVITDIKSFGFYVKIFPWYSSGLIHIRELGDDRYEFNPETASLVGIRNGREFKVGISVKVRVLRVDLIGRRLDFGLVAGGTPAQRITLKGLENARRSRARELSGSTTRGRSDRKSGSGEKAKKGFRGYKGSGGKSRTLKGLMSKGKKKRRK